MAFDKKTKEFTPEVCEYEAKRCNKCVYFLPTPECFTDGHCNMLDLDIDNDFYCKEYDKDSDK